MPRNKYPEITEEKILSVSLKLFLEKGYEQTTIQDIACNLEGLTRGAIYHHFKSKEDILNALSDRVVRAENPFERVRGEIGLNGLQKLKRLILLPVSADRMSVTMWMLPLVKNPQFLAKLLESNQRELQPNIKMIIDEGIDDGSIKVKNSHIAAELAVLLTNFWLLPSLFPCDQEVMAQKIYVLKDIFDAIGLPILDFETIKKVIEECTAYNA